MIYHEDGEHIYSPIELSILVPCLNEEENIYLVLDDLCEMIRRNNLSNVEIIVLDDSSIDSTYEKAVSYDNKMGDIVIRIIRRYEPRRGYGAIIRFGIAIANGQYCIPVSADRVDPIEIIPAMLEKMRNDVGMVQCSRYINPVDADTIPFKYKFFQTIWRFLIRLLLKQQILDSTYSFKMFRRVDVLALGVHSNGFSISPEIFFKVLLSGERVEYISHSQGVRLYGESKFLFSREGFGYSYVLLRAWFHKLGILWY